MYPVSQDIAYLGAVLPRYRGKVFGSVAGHGFGDGFASADYLHHVTLLEAAFDRAYPDREQGSVVHNRFSGAFVDDDAAGGMCGLYPPAFFGDFVAGYEQRSDVVPGCGAVHCAVSGAGSDYHAASSAAAYLGGIQLGLHASGPEP